MDTNRKQLVDSSRNQEEPDIDVNKKQNNSTPGLLTLDKIPELSFRESLLPPIKSLSTLVKKKPYYKMVSTKEAKPKKKINSNIGEQNIVTGKRIKKQL